MLTTGHVLVNAPMSVDLHDAVQQLPLEFALLLPVQNQEQIRMHSGAQ